MCVFIVTVLNLKGSTTSFRRVCIKLPSIPTHLFMLKFLHRVDCNTLMAHSYEQYGAVFAYYSIQHTLGT